MRELIAFMPGKARVDCYRHINTNCDSFSIDGKLVLFSTTRTRSASLVGPQFCNPEALTARTCSASCAFLGRRPHYTLSM